MHSTNLLLEEPIRMASILEPSKTSFFPAMTKIVGTLGPKSRSVDTISACLKAGMSVARVDFSWGDAAYHQETLENLKLAIKSTKKLCAVMLDTVGPELQVVNKNETSISLEENGTVVLTPHQGQEASSSLLPINFSGLAKTFSHLRPPSSLSQPPSSSRPARPAPRRGGRSTRWSRGGADPGAHGAGWTVPGARAEGPAVGGGERAHGGGALRRSCMAAAAPCEEAAWQRRRPAKKRQGLPLYSFPVAAPSSESTSPMPSAVLP